MPTEYIVRVTVTPSPEGDSAPPGRSVTREYRFSKLPISIGRLSDNDVEIPSQFVSGNHARIEEVGGRLCIRDLGSRNGVVVLDGAEALRIPARTPYPISSSGVDLQLGNETRMYIGSGRPPSAARAWSPPTPQPSVMPTPLELSGVGDGLPALPEVGRPLRELPPLAPPSGGFELEPGALSLPALPQRNPGWEPQLNPSEPSPPARGFEAVQPAPRPLASPQSRSPGPEFKTGSFDLSLEVLALQGLRELVASLTPGQTLDTQGDVGRLIKRLHDTLEVVCRGFVMLRDGGAQVASSLQLQRSAHERGRSALDAARDPAALASQLLDFRERAPDAAEALEAGLRELGIHQAAMLEGIVEGMRGLLEELSPESIEREVQGKRGASRLGRPERAFWDEYRARHERLSTEREGVSRVFREAFSAAYRAYHQRARRSP
jgi:predicted component of type VI protein secretion system